MRIDAEIAEMKRYPIDYSDIPPISKEEWERGHFGNERFLRSLPPDIVRELVRRRLEEFRASGYDVPALNALVSSAPRLYKTESKVKAEVER